MQRYDATLHIFVLRPPEQSFFHGELAYFFLQGCKSYGEFAELNSSVKPTKKALHKVSDALSTQFLAEYDELIKPFILLQEDEKKRSYWSIKEQIEQNECDSVIHIVRSHKAKGWQTFYIAEESFTAFMRLYIEQLSQADFMIRNCDICGKLYVCKKTRYATVCGDNECKKIPKAYFQHFPSAEKREYNSICGQFAKKRFSYVFPLFWGNKEQIKNKISITACLIL